jgi:WD40 repeat protein
MASCSQDSYIRIWKIQPLSNISDGMGGHEDLQKYESKTSFVLKDEGESKIYNITLESILAGHQESVSSAKWGVRNDRQEESKSEVSQLSDFCLLSCSFDFTVCVWKPEQETGIWSVESTLGAMQGNKHAYYGA